MSERDCEEPSPSAADHVIQQEPRAPSRVRNAAIPPTPCLDGSSGSPAVLGGYFCFMNLEEKVIVVFFLKAFFVCLPPQELRILM